MLQCSFQGRQMSLFHVFLNIFGSAGRLCQHLQDCFFVWGVPNWHGDTHSMSHLQKGQRMSFKEQLRNVSLSFGQK